jgi:hypothetical protein
MLDTIDVPCLGGGWVLARSMRARGAAAAVAVAIMTIAGTACSSGAAVPPTTQATQQARPSSSATLTLVSPTQGEVFTGSTVPVKVSLEGAKIVATTSTHLRSDEGHLHLYLDGQIVSMNYRADATLHDVAPGQHTLKIEFVATDHAPFDPRVFVEVTFEVKP